MYLALASFAAGSGGGGGRDAGVSNGGLIHRVGSLTKMPNGSDHDDHYRHGDNMRSSVNHHHPHRPSVKNGILDHGHKRPSYYKHRRFVPLVPLVPLVPRTRKQSDQYCLGRGYNSIFCLDIKEMSCRTPLTWHSKVKAAGVHRKRPQNVKFKYLKIDHRIDIGIFRWRSIRTGKLIDFWTHTRCFLKHTQGNAVFSETSASAERNPEPDLVNRIQWYNYPQFTRKTNNRVH